MSNGWRILSLAFLLASSLNVVATPIVIDSFALPASGTGLAVSTFGGLPLPVTDKGVVSDPGWSPGEVGADGYSIIGGERDVMIRALVANTFAAQASFGGGTFAFVSAGQATARADFRVEWDGSDGGAIAADGSGLQMGLGGLDLTGLPDMDALVVNMKASSTFGGSFDFTFYTDIANYSTYHWVYPNISSAQSFSFPLPGEPGAGTWVQGGMGADFSNINAIVWTGQVTGTSNSFTLSGLSIPEPRPLVLLGLGLGLLGWTGRRWRSRNWR